MALTRTPHWATREFHTFLLSRARTPFAWGSNDCALFAADAIKSFTNVDLADDFRGKYSDEVGAFRLIKQLTGGSTVADAAAYCAQKHGLIERIEPLLASRGDLVVVADTGNNNNLISGVVHLSGRHVAAMGASGIHRIDIRNVKRAWKV